MTDKKGIKKVAHFTDFLTSKVFLFFLLVTITSILILWMIFACHSEFRTSQNRIISNQSAQLKHMESILSNFTVESKLANDRIDSTINEALNDSLFTFNSNLNKREKKIVLEHYKAIFKTTLTSLGNIERQREYDILVENKSDNQIHQDTRLLLDLEFNKIQHEYEALALWAGILTVIFLIFSFYSLFKTDDLLKQGNDGLDEISSIKKESRETIERTNTKHDDIQTKLSDTEKKITELNGKLESIDKSITSVKETADQFNSLSNKIVELQQTALKIEKTILTLNEDFLEKEKRFDQIISILISQAEAETKEDTDEDSNHDLPEENDIIPSVDM